MSRKLGQPSLPFSQGTLLSPLDILGFHPRCHAKERVHGFKEDT